MEIPIGLVRTSAAVWHLTQVVYECRPRRSRKRSGKFSLISSEETGNSDELGKGGIFYVANGGEESSSEQWSGAEEPSDKGPSRKDVLVVG
uniref:Uncharacterized protein n=1 Tax=Moniliophthora roreri TaxID=221103 RepID=A0A0W0G197_MONRR